MWFNLTIWPCVHHSINQHVTISNSNQHTKICTQIPYHSKLSSLGLPFGQKEHRTKPQVLVQPSTIQRSTLRSAKAVYFIATTWNYKAMSNNKRLQRWNSTPLHSTPTSCNHLSNNSPILQKQKSKDTYTVATLAISSLSYNFYSLSTPSKL